MKFIMTNAFSINMLPNEGHNLAFRPITKEGVRNLLNNEHWESAIGHPDTAQLAGDLLDEVFPVNRRNVELNEDTSLIVVQYRGPRLEPGTTELPEGASIEFWQVYHY